ncbi:hypothetical protein J7443_20100 [Tropicibacter sp. R15_0]|nr:hypothetical protein [Tropicibacter sp. R15_0]MBO9467546.1 hypothetical protein [Tropicibacter sp. R15_0]
MSSEFTKTARAGRLRALAVLARPRSARPLRKALFSRASKSCGRNLFAA